MTHGAEHQKVFNSILNNEFNEIEFYRERRRAKRFSLSREALQALLDVSLHGYGVYFGRSFSGIRTRRRWGLRYFLTALTYFDLQLPPSVIVALQVFDIYAYEGGIGSIYIRKADRKNGLPAKKDRGGILLNRVQFEQFARAIQELKLKPDDFIVGRRDNNGMPIPISVDNLGYRVRDILDAARKKYPQLKDALASISNGGKVADKAPPSCQKVSKPIPSVSWGFPPCCIGVSSSLPNLSPLLRGAFPPFAKPLPRLSKPLP